MLKSLALVGTLVGGAASAFAGDRYMILSSGGGPSSNHYSQFLQAKTLYTSLVRRVGNENLNIAFGYGNRPETSPKFGDVHREVAQMNGFDAPEMFPGVFPANISTTKSSLGEYFKSRPYQNISAKDSFYLFVSGHGSPYDENAETPYLNNCIDVWNGAPDWVRGEVLTSKDRKTTCLSKDDLAKAFRSHRAKNNYFVLSTCFSGGFHQMAVNLSAIYPEAPKANVCGFTATVDDTYAAGCTANADGPSYQGYERSMTEFLTGKDVVTGKSKYSAEKNILTAHRKAAVEDRTIDIPMTTSEYFLWKWAGAIQKSDFVPREGAATTAEVQQIFNRSAVLGKSELARPFLAQVTALVAANPSLAAGFKGDLIQIVKEAKKLDAKKSGIEAEFGRFETTRQRSFNKMFAAWQATPVSGLERQFYRLADAQSFQSANRNFLNRMALFVESDPTAYRQYADFLKNRVSNILQWALTNPNEAIRSAYLAYQDAIAHQTALSDRYHELDTAKAHLRRIKIYREIVGAFQALKAMGDTKALQQFQALRDCETSAQLP